MSLARLCGGKGDSWVGCLRVILLVNVVNQSNVDYNGRIASRIMTATRSLEVTKYNYSQSVAHPGCCLGGG